MILVIDNYDSFTYNLVQYICECGFGVKVVRNNQITLDEVKSLKPTHIVISPGPGNPQESGICLQVIQQLYKSVPILGVCLGHQIIAHAFGGIVKKQLNPCMGKYRILSMTKKGCFVAFKPLACNEISFFNCGESPPN